MPVSSDLTDLYIVPKYSFKNIATILSLFSIR